MGHDRSLRDPHDGSRERGDDHRDAANRAQQVSRRVVDGRAEVELGVGALPEVGGDVVGPPEGVEAASDREVQGRFAGTAWLQCDSWYRDANGRIVTQWPGYMREYFGRLRRLEPAEFELVR